MTEPDKIDPVNNTEPVSDTTDEKLSLLLLDDEVDLLKALTRVLRYDYHVVSFTDGGEALAYLQQNDTAIIMSDMRMPEMDGAQFLSEARKLWPNSIRLLLTGYSDIDSTVRAVNDGGIHSYLAKPWDNEGLKLAIAKAAEVYTLKRDKARLTEQVAEQNEQLVTLNQQLESKVEQRTTALKDANKSLQALVKTRSQIFQDILATFSAIIQHRTGRSASHTTRIAELAKTVAIDMQLAKSVVSHIYLGALMHEVGIAGSSDSDLSTISVNPSILDTPETYPVIGEEIVSQIHRFVPLAEIIRHQDENYNGTGTPDHLKGEAIPMGSRILRLVKDYDFFSSTSDNPARMTPAGARSFIENNSGVLYDPMVIDAFMNVIAMTQRSDRFDTYVGLEELKVGAVLKKDLYLPNGQLMLVTGQTIDRKLLHKLREIERKTGAPIAVLV